MESGVATAGSRCLSVGNRRVALMWNVCLAGQEIAGERLPVHGSARRQLSCRRENNEGNRFTGAAC